jgi:acyl carrier protein
VTSQFADASDARRVIRDRIIQLADKRRIDARHLKDSDVIPDAGVLDSAGLMELIVWFEMTFQLEIAQSDLTLENFGTIDAMTDYLKRVSKDDNTQESD